MPRNPPHTLILRRRLVRQRGRRTDYATPPPNRQLICQAATHFGNTTQAPEPERPVLDRGPPTGGNPSLTAFRTAASAPTTTSPARGRQCGVHQLPYVPDMGAGGCTTLSNPTLLDCLFSTETH